MKNGFTPKEYAHAIAVDALWHAMHDKFGELENLTPVERAKAIAQMDKLRNSLMEKVKLDGVAYHA